MTITIRDALQLPDMVQTKLIAGESGLDRHVRWVTIVELLEDASRLSEGEFLITTGFGLESDELRRDRFIPSLIERNLSGVAIHTGFYLREIPQSFIDAANAGGLPLIEIPSEMNFSTVTKAILQPIINRQFETLSYSQAIHEQMIEVALSGGGLSAIAGELARLTQGEVTVMDALGYEIVRTGDAGVAGISTATSTITTTDVRLPISPDTSPTTTRTIPIRTAHETYGTLHLTKPSTDWHELDQIAHQHAATLCALEFVKERAVAATEWRMQGDFVEELLSGRLTWDSEVDSRSRMLGYPLTGQHLVSALHIPTLPDSDVRLTHHTRLTTLLKRLAQRRQIPYLLRERSDRLLLILPADRHSTALLEQLSTQWSAHTPDHPLQIGLGTPREQLSYLAQAADEAMFAATAYPLLTKNPSILPYDKMEGYQFLFPFHNHPDSLRALWQPHLHKLIAYDQKHGHQLIDTLHTYLAENLNGLKAAQALFIHRHTLKYRLQQIEEKTSLDLTNANHRWQLHLALMAYRLEQVMQTQPISSKNARTFI
ncbi:PucR family transcriptional regulator [Brevibacillus dissolubilis]|uniref:PucR family transcriptional regulator n=1 Tax=Brevibacillus dissolubilis TaxID=1844116 RepID=UPI00111754EB|nr:PucR family transcriptional regulator ligand-binding domain-containing protein [Brevibacillus dissolubilis]